MLLERSAKLVLNDKQVGRLTASQKKTVMEARKELDRRAKLRESTVMDD